MAFCNQCGAALPDNAAFCHVCGAEAYKPENEAEANVPAEPSVQAPAAYTFTPAQVLTKGIVGLALSPVPFANIAGVIMSSKAKKAAETFTKEHGALFGQAKVGRILGKVGFIVSIATIAWWTLYFALIIAIPIIIFAFQNGAE